MSRDITELLLDWNRGNHAALDRLIPTVHDHLRRLAHRYMRKERAGHTLQTTAVINEAYLRLVDLDRVHWQDRAHFFAIAATLMRRVLIDYGRSRQSLKRGAGPRRVPLEALPAGASPNLPDLIDLAKALDDLAVIDPRRTQVVELRFFAGLSVEETATVLSVSAETVKRDWRLAKVWLLRELEGRGDA